MKGRESEMSLFEKAVNEMKLDIIDELERRVWERLEPRIQQELRTRHMPLVEVAEYLHVSEQTVRRMVRDKELPSFRVRNQIFVRQQDVDQWIHRQITEALKGGDRTYEADTEKALVPARAQRKYSSTKV
jgi:excisionase family DNA binding protein